MPYTPQELKAKIKERNEGLVSELVKNIDNAMLGWDGTQPINISPTCGLNNFIIEELKRLYSSWDIEYTNDQRDGECLSFSEKKPSRLCENSQLEFGGQSRPWDRYDYPG